MKGRKPNVLQFPLDEDSPIAGAPPMPKDLDAVAKKTWRRLVKQLDAAGILSTLDLDILATYCAMQSEEKQLLSLLAEAPNPFLLADETGKLALNPLRRELAKVRDHLIRLRSELGLAPVSRTRLKVNAKGKASGPSVRDRRDGPPPPEWAREGGA